jgi:hypothetical protein
VVVHKESRKWKRREGKRRGEVERPMRNQASEDVNRMNGQEARKAKYEV